MIKSLSVLGFAAIAAAGGRFAVAADAPGAASPAVTTAPLDRPHVALYEKVRPSIVGISARGTLGDVVGSGIILDAEGHILTTSSVVGPTSDQIRVWLAGPRVVPARLVGVRPEDECALIRIEAHKLVPIPLGDSDAVAIGQRVYTIGNAENALIHDDQATLSTGILSAQYGLREERMGSSYTGRVLETTAAVNPGIEGGALVDAHGRLVGMLILNYSPLRWLGTAIPINALKPVITELRREDKSGRPAEPAAAPPDAKAYFGAEFEAKGPDAGGLPIRSIDAGGPAEAAGLAAGDILLELAGKKVSTPADVEAQLRRHAPGSLVWVKVVLGGEAREIRVMLGARRRSGP